MEKSISPLLSRLGMVMKTMLYLQRTASPLAKGQSWNICTT
jgi:hypothetical protein